MFCGGVWTLVLVLVVSQVAVRFVSVHQYPNLFISSP